MLYDIVISHALGYRVLEGQATVEHMLKEMVSVFDIANDHIEGSTIFKCPTGTECFSDSNQL